MFSYNKIGVREKLLSLKRLSAAYKDYDASTVYFLVLGNQLHPSL